MFGKKKPVKRIEYDEKTQMPVIRCSICNGEQVGGLKDMSTGKFQEIMLIRGEEDRNRFCQMVGKEDISKEY